jgi:ABC-type dipeptide/oligopeptide/nickel transport system permease component
MGNLPLFWDTLKHLILPGVTQSAYIIGVLTRIGRSTMLEVLRQDYIMTAPCKRSGRLYRNLQTCPHKTPLFRS